MPTDTIEMPLPESFFFDMCRRIVWGRLTYDKLYALYNQEAQGELKGMWIEALRQTITSPDGCVPQSRIYDVASSIEIFLASDEADWQRIARLVERRVDMRRAVDDFFLGVESPVIIEGIGSGEYAPC